MNNFDCYTKVDIFYTCENCKDSHDSVCELKITNTTTDSCAPFSCIVDFRNPRWEIQKVERSID